MVERWEEVVIRFQICIFDILNTAVSASGTTIIKL